MHSTVVGALCVFDKCTELKSTAKLWYIVSADLQTTCLKLKKKTNPTNKNCNKVCDRVIYRDIIF